MIAGALCASVGAAQAQQVLLNEGFDNVPALGAGAIRRLAIVYSGAADTSNCIGIDSLSVTAVPEPQTWLLTAAGLAACLHWGCPPPPSRALIRPPTQQAETRE